MRRFFITLLALVAMVMGVRAEGETPYAVWCASNSTLYFTNTSEVLTADGTFIPEGATDPVTITNVWSGTDVTASASYSPAWRTWGVYNNIVTVVFESSFADVLPTSCNYWFNGCSKLTTVTGIAHLNTSEVTDMYGMFGSCSELTTLNLSGWTNTLVTNMSSMFSQCQKLATLNLTNFA